MRVLVVAEPSMFEEGIGELLRQEPGLEIVGQGADAQEAVRLIEECHPDVILLADGESATGCAPEFMRLVREGFHIRVVEVHLATNTLCLYSGERQPIRQVQDLVDSVRHLCEGSGRGTQVPLTPVVGESVG